MGNPFRPPMNRVSRERPCPVCGKPDWCLIAPDRAAAICQRVESGAAKRAGEAGWLHILDPRRDPAIERVQVEKPTKQTPKPRRFQELLNVRQPPGPDTLGPFAKSLGVTPQSLARLNVRQINDGGWWFPERDEAGLVIGLQHRATEGSKKRIFGSSAGLTYADDWDTGVGPLLLPEGASDTCALMDLGLSAIGRPSNRAGCSLLGDMLRSFERPIIVVGEYDQKADGQWPGKEGAIHTAKELARRLERPVHWALPPDKAKDVRRWLILHGCDEPAILGKVFLEGLLLEAVTPPATVRVEHRKSRTINLDEYREAMVKARLLSLDRPAIYLDRSGTGTGKSHADRLLLRSLLSTGAAP
jgi:hypothetical protein